MKYWESQFSQYFLYIYIILAILSWYYHGLGLDVWCLTLSFWCQVAMARVIMIGETTHTLRPAELGAFDSTNVHGFFGEFLTGMGPNLVL